MLSKPILYLTGADLSIEEVLAVARYKEKHVQLNESIKEQLTESRQYVEKIVQDRRVVYGITTGFGKFKNVTINEEQTSQLQENLILSHATGTGEPLAEEIVRAAILVRVNSLIKGNSGVRLEVLQKLLDILNNDIYPYVPAQGSVGSSGDLAPLSHIYLLLLGKGEVIVDGKRLSGREVLESHGIFSLRLAAKEGLALTNGTSMMTGIAALAVADAEQLIKLADISGAMTLEATMGTVASCDALVHAVRPHPGQQKVAENIRKLCAESEIIESHKDCDRVQDAYSLRCLPQVHGAVRDTFDFVRRVVATELNSATDNPLIFAKQDKVISCGNFHGEPIAFAMDFLGIAISELANIAERRVNRLLDPATSEGLPAFLIPPAAAGVSSGYMIAQYTAAALVSENKILAHPASVDSIPTSANQEDHVSMGTIASRKARDIIKNSAAVIAIEFICASQALDFRQPLSPGRGTKVGREVVRRLIPFYEYDRTIYNEIETALNQLMKNNILLTAVENAIGKL